MRQKGYTKHIRFQGCSPNKEVGGRQTLDYVKRQ